MTQNKDNHFMYSAIAGLIISFTIQVTVVHPTFANERTSNCHSQAQTDLENSYCDIVSKKPNANLPVFLDFKKNDPKMQYLLLKSPAKKLRITLPKPKSMKKKNPVKTEISSDNIEKISPQIRVQNNIHHATPDSQRKPADTTPHIISQPQTRGLSRCTLSTHDIQCAKKRYQRVLNKPNHQLSKNALTSHNTLTLPQKSSSSYQSLTDNRYLSTVYAHYIHKMLEIGLGDGTMSFTKFAAIYESNKQSTNNFSQRMSKMYEFLKLDKKNNAIQSLYNNNQPASIDACMTLSKTIIICDNKYQNWVYQYTSK